MRKYALGLLAGVLLLGCNQGEEDSQVDAKQDEQHGSVDTSDVDSGAVESSFIPDTLWVSEFFPKEFPHEGVEKVLSDLKICNTEDPAVQGKRFIPCNPLIFRVLPLSAEKEYDKGFVVEIWEGVWSAGKQVVTAVNKNGKWVVTNRLMGDVIGQTTSPTGVYDILIRHKDNSLGDEPYDRVMVQYSWIGDRYAPKKVLNVGGYDMLPAQSDSLMTHYFTNSPWGE